MISKELQRIYASAPVNIPFYDALYLSHPDWPDGLAYITNTIQEKTFNLGGQPVAFQPATFSIKLPRRDDLGLVELQITFPVTRLVVQLLDVAEPSDVPITAIVTTYLDSSPDPQMEPIELKLDNIVLGNETGTGTAQRIDLLNRTYPRNIVRPLFYPGLWR